MAGGAPEDDFRQPTSAETRTAFEELEGAHCLEFDSWWMEGGSKRFVYLRYNIAESAFQIAIDQDTNIYHVPKVYGHRSGEPVTVWDLRVGAELDILGRVTTLQHCSQMTAQWNTYWAERLVPLRQRLVEELNKYETKKRAPWLQLERCSREAGSVDLRLLLNQIEEIRARLRGYRPRLAEKLSVPQEMYEIERLHELHAGSILEEDALDAKRQFERFGEDATAKRSFDGLPVSMDDGAQDGGA